jgi:hypothetical protein
MDFIDHLKRTPLYRGSPWNVRTQYWIVNWCVLVLWFLRIFSPAAWILMVFQVQDREGRFHSAPKPTELYVLIMNTCVPFILFALPTTWLSHWAFLVASVLLIIEVCQRHIYLMVIRPAIDQTYTQYNFARTMLLTLISYQGLISLFGIAYLSRFSDQFSISEFNPVAAWSVSAGILTGTGFSGITPKPGTTAALLGGIESIVGILFLTTILGLALSRASAKAIDTPMLRGAQLVNPGQIRNALSSSGKAEAIDYLQGVLQTDLWVTGGWLRSFALGHETYDGDVDLLVSDLSHEDLARVFVEKGIKFTRARLGGFKFSPVPGVKVDCFSTHAFGAAMSIQESFRYFNTTVNAAAFKFSSPEFFFSHPLFDHDVSKRLLRILPDGLQQQPLHERGRSLVATLRLLTRDNLALFPDDSTRDLVRSVAKDEQFIFGCRFICKLLIEANRQHEAAVLSGWLN